MADELDHLIEAAELGEQAQAFVESTLGKKVLALAEEQVEAALIELSKVSPTDAAKISELQMRARFGRTFARWLGEIITDGENAIVNYVQQREAA